MESFWSRLRQFIYESFATSKFKYCLPGCIMGFIGGKSFLFNGATLEVATYILKFLATIIMAFSSGLATAYASLIIERYKNRKNNVAQTHRRRKKGKGDQAA